MIFSLGFVGQKTFKLDIKSVSTTALYLMVPVLIFRTYYEAEIDTTYLHILSYVLVLSLSMVALVQLISRIKGYSAPVTSGLILSTAFMNNGNLGVPLVLFALGQQVFLYAVPIMVFHIIVMSSVGLYYALKGKAGAKESLITVAKMPIIHAMVIALLWQYLNIPLSEHVFKAIKMVADASLVMIMLVLGMQLADIKLHNPRWSFIALGLVLRLLVSPVIAWLFTLVVPVEPLLAKVMIIEAAMPSATIATMYALQFDSEPDLVCAINLISTVASVFTLTALLFILH